MKIGISLLPYTKGGQGGSEVYIRNLLIALSQIEPDNEYTLFLNSQAAEFYSFGARFHRVFLPTANHNQIVRSLIEQALLPYQERRWQLDVLFSNYVIPFTPGGCARIVNIHDMLYEKYPTCIGFTKRTWWRFAIPLSVRRSDVVLTVSHASKKDIAERFPQAAHKVLVQSEGVDFELQNQVLSDAHLADALSQLRVEKPFILCSATFGKHKNINRLLEAFQIVRQSYPTVMMVLTGRYGNYKDSVEPELLRGVLMTGYINIQDLAAVYSSAALYVLPSIFEGFGLSILEAQYFGCPVATSRIGATSEVGGDAVALFDPFDVQSIAGKITEILASPEEQRRLALRGKMNLQRYSWELSARQFLDACQLAVSMRVR